MRTTTTKAGLVAVAIGAMLASLALSACQPTQPTQPSTTPDTYVALGDSAAAAPLVPDMVTGADTGCFRSTNDYPALTAPKIKAARFVDATCSSALIGNLYSPQKLDVGGPHPAQLDYLDARTKVVTITIGGNDLPFSDVLLGCVQLNPFGPNCRSKYLVGGRDLLRERIATIGVKMDKAITDIKAKAPNATVFVVGYMTYLPPKDGCWPSVPVLPSDIPYLYGINQALNTMFAERARANGAEFVDVATPGADHHACAADKWIEPLVPTTVAFPVHPSASGTRGAAAAVTKAINAKITR